MNCALKMISVPLEVALILGGIISIDGHAEIALLETNENMNSQGCWRITELNLQLTLPDQ
jgi:hypothetical protein